MNKKARAAAIGVGALLMILVELDVIDQTATWLQIIGAVLAGAGLPYGRLVEKPKNTATRRAPLNGSGRIRRLPPVILVALTLTLSACCRQSTAFRAYVEADRQTYNYAAPTLEGYLRADESLTDQQLELRLLALESWSVRIQAARKAAGGAE